MRTHRPARRRRGSLVPADRPAFTLGAGACAVPWDPAKCSRTAGLPVVDDGAFLNLTHRTRYSVLPPVTSGLVKTKQAFRFGRLEIRARMPRGDWLWPAIWLVPSDDAYGGWPTSGEIDIVESRGNGRDACGPGQGNWHFGSFRAPGGEIGVPAHALGGGGPLSDAFHVYGLEWGPEGLYTYIDDRSNIVLAVNFTKESFFDRGSKWEMTCFKRGEGGRCDSWLPSLPEWDGGGATKDPWNGSALPKAASFDRAFHLQLNVAVGCTGYNDRPFFPDHLCKDKPWRNGDKHTAESDFLGSFESWWPSWGGNVTDPARGASRNASMQIESVRYWAP